MDGRRDWMTSFFGGHLRNPAIARHHDEQVAWGGWPEGLDDVIILAGFQHSSTTRLIPAQTTIEDRRSTMGNGGNPPHSSSYYL